MVTIAGKHPTATLALLISTEEAKRGRFAHFRAAPYPTLPNRARARYRSLRMPGEKRVVAEKSESLARVS